MRAGSIPLGTIEALPTVNASVVSEGTIDDLFRTLPSAKALGYFQGPKRVTQSSLFYFIHTSFAVNLDSFDPISNLNYRSRPNGWYS
jgi:hypothetical protein